MAPESCPPDPAGRPRFGGDAPVASGSAPTPSTGGEPRFTAQAAVALLRAHFGLEATVRPLPSERDQNFAVQTSAGGRFVLKISRTGEDPALVACENAVMRRLSSVPGYSFPQPNPSTAGEPVVTVAGPAGRPHLARLLSWVPGIPLAEYRPRTAALVEQVGILLGSMSRVLVGFSHRAAQREFHWDLQQGRAVVAAHRQALEGERRALVDEHMAVVERIAGPLLEDLRRAVVHGDANDHNVLVEPPSRDDPLAPPRITGLVDFGDLVYSYQLAEPAVAAAYAMLDQADPLATAAALVAGYHREHPIPIGELAALYPLICLRLTTSVVLAAYQQRHRPENAYLGISEAPAWRLLGRLAGIDPGWAHAVFRDACALPASATSGMVVDWLASHADESPPILAESADSPIVLDLGMGSLALEGGTALDPDRVGEYVRRRLDPGVVGIGSYGEVRGWSCASPAADVAGDGTAAPHDQPGNATERATRWSTNEAADPALEQPTVHLGLDLFLAPGTMVRSPLAGTVLSVRHMTASVGRSGPGTDTPPGTGAPLPDTRMDAVPAGSASSAGCVVVRHEPPDAPAFLVRYGGFRHPPVEETLAVGDRLRRGDPLGRVAPRTGIGGLPPHLHVQVITDLLDREASVPSMARPSAREVWQSFCPDPGPLLGLPAATVDRSDDSTAILAARRELLGPSLSVSYRHPLVIVHGRGHHLYDAEGQAYLDCVNNVAHVGHGHPRVVAALQRQAAVLNTNTRYLHPQLVRYAERLTALFPAPLRVCFFVCSGSEANELALRMARTYTGAHDVVVVEGAYHGNTNALVEISPYKFNGPGGTGAPAYVHPVVMPDVYRGPYRREDRGAGVRYAGHVQGALEKAARAGRRVAAFFCESLLGCGGQIVLPDGYLAEAFRHVRAAGAVCIADEVQVGFGRVGSHFWGFQTQGVVPDIVTLGKPMGNGHPLAAVVTTPEIARSFANGMEYFNTFGGNPVSCAVGLAVLDVIVEEGLQERAARVGDHFLASLRGLMDVHPLIGDVRGLGMFLGVELVRDRETRAPAPRHATYIVERLREQRILLSTDGPFHNVIKIKPPLSFGEAEADRVVTTLDQVLRETPLRLSGDDALS